MYSILEHVSSVTDLQEYINYGIIQTFEKKDIEWIMRNCSKDVIQLFYDTYHEDNYLISIVRFLVLGDNILMHINRSIKMDKSLYRRFDPSQFTYDELRSILTSHDARITISTAKYLVRMDHGNLIPMNYITEDVDIIKYLEKIGRIVDYKSVIPSFDFDDDIDPFIIRRCFEVGVDVKFYPTSSNVMEIIKHVRPEEVWDTLNMETDDRCYTDFLDILYENHIPMYPQLSFYMNYQEEWSLEHIHYFSVLEVLDHYIRTDDIRPEMMEKMDYSGIVLPEVIPLTDKSYAKITSLKYDLHQDNVFQVLNYDDSFLLELSYKEDINYITHKVHVVNAIRLLHYIPELEVEIKGPSKNSDILEAARLYGEGYSTLCHKYSCHTTRYVMELVNKNRKVCLRPGFEDILVMTVV